MWHIFKKRVLFSGLAIALGLSGAEGLSRAAIKLARPLLVEEIRGTDDIFREQSHRIKRLLDPDSAGSLALDPLLGWRYRAGYRDSANTINDQGLRGERRYARHPARGVVRVAAFGDSFVYGNEVADSAAWPALVERWFPQLEVLNYGVGGYGVDQAYLRFCTEGMTLAPQIVLIGFTTDDLRRVVNVYRRFISNREFPLIKPRFLLDGRGDLTLLPNPAPRPSDYERYEREPRAVIELGPYDYWYRSDIYQEPLYDLSGTVRLLTNFWIRVSNRYLAPNRLFQHGEFNPSSTAFKIQVALFERFAAAVKRAGAQPIVVLLPDRTSVARAREGRQTLFAPLVEALARHDLEYLDLTSAFFDATLAGGVDDWFMRGGHYAPAGNAIVARWLGHALLAERGASSRPPLRGPTCRTEPVVAARGSGDQRFGASDRSQGP
jgi:lysophospholipase L1-like esterase